MKDPRTLYRYFLYASLVLIGIVIGVAVRHYYHMPIEETINIVDLATLVVTVFLAVYIPEVLNRKSEVQKDKKDLIEKRIEELQSLYRRVNLLIQGEEPINPKDFLVVQNILDVAQHKLETLITLLTYAEMHTSFADEINTLRSLSKQHQELLWVQQEPKEDFTYPDDIQQREEKLYNKIDKATCLLIFKISEA
ncbi:MAG: hypothetical protein LUE98_06830 [Tannerellaceae bacterium]|nr:hypothetical protein [Tannerellaceae bacterium]